MGTMTDVRSPGINVAMNILPNIIAILLILSTFFTTTKADFYFRKNFIYEKMTTYPVQLNPGTHFQVVAYSPCDLVKSQEVMKELIKDHEQLCELQPTVFNFLNNKMFIEDHTTNFVLLANEGGLTIDQAFYACETLGLTVAEVRRQQDTVEIQRLLGASTKSECWAGVSISPLTNGLIFSSDKGQVGSFHKDVFQHGRKTSLKNILTAEWDHRVNRYDNSRFFSYQIARIGTNKQKLRFHTYLDRNWKRDERLPVICNKRGRDDGNDPYKVFKDNCQRYQQKMRQTYRTISTLVQSVYPQNMPQPLTNAPTELGSYRIQRDTAENQAISNENYNIGKEEWYKLLQPTNITLEDYCDKTGIDMEKYMIQEAKDDDFLRRRKKRALAFLVHTTLTLLSFSLKAFSIGKAWDKLRDKNDKDDDITE